MLFKSSLFLIPAFLATTAVARLNDWNKPCFDGECAYDLPKRGASSQEGSLKIWGSNKNAITDITPAGGWVILDCDPEALVQEVRIVCQKSDESDTRGCGNLFRSLGKSGKIVRLPENCGKNAFGRIVKQKVSHDQRIPAAFSSKLVRRAGEPAIVRSITIDTDFAALDTAEVGQVNIAIEGATASNEQSAAARLQARQALFDKLIEKRGFFQWLEDVFNDFNRFNLSESKDLTLINVDKTYNLFNYAISCPAGNGWPAYSASARADLRATANVVATVGVAAYGTIVPPNLEEFGVFAALNAAFNGYFDLVASASGTADTGFKTLYTLAIPGLDWPGILTIGPTFKIGAQALATVNIDVNLHVNLAYTLNNARLYFPKETGQTSGVGVSPGTSALSLSVNPSLAARVYAEAHIIPRLDIGINAIGGAATATVYLIADASADATGTFNADATIIVPRDEVEELEARDNEVSVREIEERQVTGSVNGCVDVNAGINIYAGADANFFGLFDKSTSISLFNRRWDLYAQCWGASTKRSDIESLLFEARHLVPRALTCPSTNVATLVKLI